MVSLAIAAAASMARADEAFGPAPSWEPSTTAEVREELMQYVDSLSLDEAQRGQIAALWPPGKEAAGAELLDRLAQSLALADSEIRRLVELCSGPRRQPAPPEFPWLLDDTMPPLVRNNMRLYYARWLMHESLYDESLVLLSGLEVDQVVDPATLLFCRAVAHHRLVQTEESRRAALRLLEREALLPRRYQQLASLMKEDLKDVPHDSLDHISRRMGDVQRRLWLGRAGKKVREIEDGVIASLDKLIEELEQQQQQQQQQSPAGGPADPNARPADDSRIAPLKGPGKVDPRDIGQGSGWGSLPPKQREEALQQIGKEFPAHLREAIEQYFRRTAAEDEIGE